MLDRKVITAFTCGLVFCFLFGYTMVKSKKSKVLGYEAKAQAIHNKYIHKLPEDITFAGEKVHFYTPASYQSFERELHYNTKHNSSTRLLLRNVRIWLPEIEYIIRKNQLPDDFKYLAVAESNLTNAISHKNAVGFWQFTKGTAEDLGLTINDEVDERYHPIMATEAACRYFKKSYKIFGNWTSSAASYNRGISGLLRAYNDQQVENFYALNLNDETSRYLFKILAMKDLISDPTKYNFTIKSYKRNSYIKKIKIDTSITNLIQFSQQIKVPYLTLKEYNPWILKNTLTVEKGKSYTILVPHNQVGKADPEKTETESTPAKDHVLKSAESSTSQPIEKINPINLNLKK
jgi:membrane-bound lytic murein transglycosylase D